MRTAPGYIAIYALTGLSLAAAVVGLVSSRRRWAMVGTCLTVGGVGVYLVAGLLTAD